MSTPFNNSDNSEFLDEKEIIEMEAELARKKEVAKVRWIHVVLEQEHLAAEKREEELKRKEEEENAAKAYAEFLDAFQGEDAARRKAGSAFVKSGQAAPYEPSVRTRGEPSRTAQMFENDSRVSTVPPWCRENTDTSCFEACLSPACSEAKG